MATYRVTIYRRCADVLSAEVTAEASSADDAKANAIRQYEAGKLNAEWQVDTCDWAEWMTDLFDASEETAQ